MSAESLKQFSNLWFSSSVIDRSNSSRGRRGHSALVFKMLTGSHYCRLVAGMSSHTCGWGMLTYPLAKKKRQSQTTIKSDLCSLRKWSKSGSLVWNIWRTQYCRKSHISPLLPLHPWGLTPARFQYRGLHRSHRVPSTFSRQRQEPWNKKHGLYELFWFLVNIFFKYIL